MPEPRKSIAVPSGSWYGSSDVNVGWRKILYRAARPISGRLCAGGESLAMVRWSSVGLNLLAVSLIGLTGRDGLRSTLSGLPSPLRGRPSLIFDEIDDPVVGLPRHDHFEPRAVDLDHVARPDHVGREQVDVPSGAVRPASKVADAASHEVHEPGPAASNCFWDAATQARELARIEAGIGRRLFDVKYFQANAVVFSPASARVITQPLELRCPPAGRARRHASGRRR